MRQHKPWHDVQIDVSVIISVQLWPAPPIKSYPVLLRWTLSIHYDYVKYVYSCYIVIVAKVWVGSMKCTMVARTFFFWLFHYFWNKNHMNSNTLCCFCAHCKHYTLLYSSTKYARIRVLEKKIIQNFPLPELPHLTLLYENLYRALCWLHKCQICKMYCVQNFSLFIIFWLSITWLRK